MSEPACWEAGAASKANRAKGPLSIVELPVAEQRHDE